MRAESASQAVKGGVSSRAPLPTKRRVASAVAAETTSTAGPRPGTTRLVASPTAYCESPSNATCASDAAANAEPDGFGNAHSQPRARTPTSNGNEEPAPGGTPAESRLGKPKKLLEENRVLVEADRGLHRHEHEESPPESPGAHASAFPIRPPASGGWRSFRRTRRSSTGRRGASSRAPCSACSRGRTRGRESRN